MPDTVQLIDPSGQSRAVPLAEASALLSQPGWRQHSTIDTSRLATDTAHEQDYGGTSGAAKAAAYSVLSGITLSASDFGFRALGAKPEDLRGYREQNPTTSLVGDLIGAAIPAVVAPESLLARTPAGAVSKIGRAIVESAEGGSVLGRAATAAAGAAAEGSLYGGGQYLTQVALENKPLAAEGFLASMGHGALWAAPIGGALSLGSDALVRAKSLFPRGEVSRQAARAVDVEATDALTQAVRDGDQMLNAARAKVAQLDAKAGASQSMERSSRAMFGAAEPATIENQVVSATDKAALTEAIDDYAAARSRFDDWVATEADPELEAALLRVQSPDVQVGAPDLHRPQFGESAPATPSGPGVERRWSKGTPGPHEPPQMAKTGELPPLPLADQTTKFAPEDLGLRFDPVKRVYHAPSEVIPLPKNATEALVLRSQMARADAAALPEAERAVAARRPSPFIEGRKDLTKKITAEPKAALSLVRGAADTGDPLLKAPIEQLSSRQLAQHQDALDRVLSGLDPQSATYKELSQRWDDVAARIRSGEAAKTDYALTATSGKDDGDLLALLEGTKAKLDAGADIKSIGEPGAATYRADKAERSAAAAEQARAKARAARQTSETGDPFLEDELDRIRERMAAREAKAGREIDDAALNTAAEDKLAKQQLAQTIVSKSIPKRMSRIASDPEEVIQRALRKRNGGGVDIGADLQRAATVIDKLESASAQLVHLLGEEAPQTAVMNARKYAAMVRAQHEASGAAAARAAVDVDTKVIPAITKQQARNEYELQALAGLEDQVRRGEVPGNVPSALTPEGVRLAAERELALQAGQRTMVDKGIRDAMKDADLERRAVTGVASALAKSQKADAKAAQRAVTTLDKERTADLKRGVSISGVAALADDVASKLATTATSEAPAKVDDAKVAKTDTKGALGVAADVGTALEVLHAMGVNVPDVRSIPVIGPILSMFLKARAVLGILGRKGGSIGRSTESVVASKAAAARDRLSAATQQVLDVGARTTRAAIPLAGPGGALAHRLFPGDGDIKSKDPRVLYQARMDELARAQAPGALRDAVLDRIRTADPDLQDAIVSQTERVSRFIASKAPRQSMLQTMLPGDGEWHPSRTQLEEFSRYIAAANDPIKVLEDAARGHVTYEGAETLRVLWPQIFAEAQRELLESAPTMMKKLPYSRRASISILFRVPVDGTMSPEHIQYLAPPQPVAPTQAQQPLPAGAPMLTAPLATGQATLTPTERRAGE